MTLARPQRTKLANPGAATRRNCIKHARAGSAFGAISEGPQWMLSAVVSTVTGVSDQSRELYHFELEPEIRDWLDSLSDSDFKRIDEVCGLLAEKGTAGRAVVRSPGGSSVGSSCPASPVLQAGKVRL